MNKQFNKFINFACYFFGVFFSGFILIFEKENQNLKNNALQAFLFHAFIIVIFVPSMWLGTWIMLNFSKTSGIIFLGIGSFFQIVMLCFWLYALVQVLRNQTPVLPIIGKILKTDIKSNI